MNKKYATNFDRSFKIKNNKLIEKNLLPSDRNLTSIKEDPFVEFSEN